MSKADEEFVRRLDSALSQEADSLPYARDLTNEAIARARSIRRRRTAAGVAVLAALAVAVPFGLQATDWPRTAPAPATEPLSGSVQQTLSNLDALPEGERPVDQYAQNGVFFLPDGGTTDFEGLDWLAVVAWGDAAAVTESFPDSREYSEWGLGRRLYVYDNTSEQAPDVLVEQGAESTVASADRRWLAYVDAGEPGAGATVTVADAQTGRSNSVALDGRSLEVLAVIDGTVYIQDDYVYEGTLRSWSADDGFRTLPYDASMVSDDGSLVGDWTGGSVARGGHECYRLVDLAEGDTRWENCDWKPSAVSPDGRWVYAPAIGVYPTGEANSGYGPSQVAVLDAETGQPVRELRIDDPPGHGFTPYGYGYRVRDARWESNNLLLLQVESAGETALVRLDILTGEVELATEPVPYTADDSRQLPPPYMLG